MDLEKKTTQISNIEHKPLEVEWRTHHPYVRKPGEKDFRRIDKHVVALVLPADCMHKQTYLVDMSTRTALNLLAWLENERPLLEELDAKGEA